MSVSAVYVIVNDAKSIHLVNPDGRMVDGPAAEEITTGTWQLGPLFLYERVVVEDGELTDEDVGRLAGARIAANELVEIVAQHELDKHDGEACLNERAGVVAFVAHSVGLGVGAMPRVSEILQDYEHEHEGHEHG